MCHERGTFGGTDIRHACFFERGNKKGGRGSEIKDKLFTNLVLFETGNIFVLSVDKCRILYYLNIVSNYLHELQKINHSEVSYWFV